MSTVPGDMSGEPLPAEPERSESTSLPPRAKAFLYVIGALAAAEVIQHIGARPQVSLKDLAKQNGLPV